MSTAHPSHEAYLKALRAHLRTAYGNQRWVVAMDVVQPATRLGRELLNLGATDVLAVAGSIGTGPYDASVPHRVLDVRGDTMMGGIRACETAMQHLPTSVVARIDAMDPERSAAVIRPPFSSGSLVAGRRCWGGRPARWRALEDKTVIDALWDACGVPRAPFRVVSNDPNELEQAHAQLNRGHGTVWAADNRDGWHGGASGLRWVRSTHDANQAIEWMGSHAHRVRMMPFLEGIPCSIHGIVFDEYVVALRPCEMVVFRQSGSMKFQYARAATFWDPPSADRAEMRSMVKKVGAHIRKTVGYRGVFTIDGILSEDGFRPTELNPRFGAAIGVVSGAVQDLDLYLLHLAIVERRDLDWQPRQLERVLLDIADRHRRGSTMQGLPHRITRESTAGLVPEGRGWRVAQEHEEPHATAILGPTAFGCMLRITLVPEHTPVGPPTAPRAAAMLATLARHWSLEAPHLEPARSVR